MLLQVCKDSSFIKQMTADQQGNHGDSSSLSSSETAAQGIWLMIQTIQGSWIQNSLTQLQTVPPSLLTASSTLTDLSSGLLQYPTPQLVDNCCQLVKTIASGIGATAGVDKTLMEQPNFRRIAKYFNKWGLVS